MTPNIHLAPCGDGSWVLWDDIDPVFSGTLEECQAFAMEGGRE